MDQAKAAGLNLKELTDSLNTNIEGLTEEEANKRLLQNGQNIFKNNRYQFLYLLFRQFNSSLAALLFVASIFSFVLGNFTDGIIILTILLINIALGFFQEYHSEKATEHLERLISHKVLVKRNGHSLLIDDKLLVIGDIVILEEGDVVPADIKLINSNTLLVNESLLTGESEPIDKKPLGLLLAGSLIEKGEGLGVIYAIGASTRLGKISNLSQNIKKVTQYERSLASFSSYLLKITLVTLFFIFTVKIIMNGNFNQLSSLFLFSVALAVSVIPEALPIITTVTLSRGALQLSKKHVLIRRLSSLEDLGNINLLCTDKTGTLTENKLTVQEIVSADRNLFEQLICACSEIIDDKKKKVRSSYTTAFLNYISLENQDKSSKYHQIREYSFDPSARRRRIIIEDHFLREQYLVEIGSAETILKLSNMKSYQELLGTIAKESENGLRHLALAYKKIRYTADLDLSKNENNLTFLGYARLTDPLRPTAKLTITHAEKLGINIKILTGDSKEVAGYIGKQVGLVSTSAEILSGEEISQLSESQLLEKVEGVNIFAEVTPEQKYQIIRLLKTNHVVGYQGDGINDAPSLKLADVAIAVDSATDVAKENSDIVLLHKDLEVIINGIHFGREIFVNINKYIKHTMVGNFANFFSLGSLYLFSQSLPLLPIQLLLSSLITDLPLLAISTDNVNSKEVENPEKYDIKPLIRVSLFLGSFTTIIELLFFFLTKHYDSIYRQTGLFLFLTLIQIVVIISLRNNDYLWKGKRPSVVLALATGMFFLINLALPFITPVAQIFFLTALPQSLLILILLSTVGYLILLDIVKVRYNHFFNT